MDRQREEALLAKIRSTRGAQRDRAISAVLDALQPAIRGICFRLTAHEADAEDAVQDTLFAVYRGIDGFRGDSRVSTWAYRIAVRNATKVRARRRKHEGDRHAVEALTTVPSEVTPRDLRRALASLSVPHASVLALFALEGMTHNEIADVLGVPEGTIWSRLHTARKRLAEALEATTVEPNESPARASVAAPARAPARS